MVGAEAQAVLLLLQRLREHGDLRAHGVGDLDGHVPEAAEADDGDLLAGPGAPVSQRGVGGDAGAQQRRGGGRVDALGHAQDVVGVDDDVGGVAALGGGAVAVGGGVGADHAVQAVLLVAARQLAHSPQELTMQPTPTRSPTWWRVTSAADLGDDADDLVTGTTGKGCGPQSPLTVWMSEWQMPAYSISMRTSFAPTSRRSMVVGARGWPAAGHRGGQLPGPELRRCALLAVRAGPHRLGLADPDRLDVAELPDPVRRQLAAVAGVLHAAERQL